jgi:hypothetical protein
MHSLMHTSQLGIGSHVGQQQEQQQSTQNNAAAISHQLDIKSLLASLIPTMPKELQMQLQQQEQQQLPALQQQQPSQPPHQQQQQVLQQVQGPQAAFLQLQQPQQQQGCQPIPASGATTANPSGMLQPSHIGGFPKRTHLDRPMDTYARQREARGNPQGIWPTWDSTKSSQLPPPPPPPHHKHPPMQQIYGHPPDQNLENGSHNFGQFDLGLNRGNRPRRSSDEGFYPRDNSYHNDNEGNRAAQGREGQTQGQGGFVRGLDNPKERVCVFFNLPVGCRREGCKFQHVRVSQNEVQALLATMPGHNPNHRGGPRRKGKDMHSEHTD